jgi:3-hydroxyacyl-CoA dehydrogenase
MGLVEVVRPLTGSRATIDAATGFARACGKETVGVEDRAGFVVNALLFPSLNGAVFLLECGTASKEDIDAAMVGGCGFPLGPFALHDLVGLDTSVSSPTLSTLNTASRSTPRRPCCGGWWPPTISGARAPRASTSTRVADGRAPRAREVVR